MNLFPIISSYITIISPYILDITERKAGLMVFVKSHIPSRNLNDFKIPSNIQIILFEVSLRKEKWLVASIFNASCQKKFPWYLTYLQEFYSTRYENVIILCDFNIGAENNLMNDFIQKHMFYNTIKQNTCFKDDGGSCIDLHNCKFEIFICDDKLLENWYDICYSQNKI